MAWILMRTVPKLEKAWEKLHVNVHKGVQMTGTSVTFTLLIKAASIVWTQTGFREVELAAAFSTRAETL